ncbi:MAG: phosphatase PAP2 family protein [Methylocystis sp.]
MPNPLSSAARLSSISGRSPIGPRLSFWASRFVEVDLGAVRRISAATERPAARMIAVAISKLGNGWIYPILAALIFSSWGWPEAKRMILLAALNAAMMHILYPLIKKRFKRLRPFKVDPRLPSLLPTLDEHSFPSGHAMTLTGVLAPIVLLWPAMALSAVAMACCMAWSRIATGHHYPSDVAAGVLLGVCLGYPLSVNMLVYL